MSTKQETENDKAQAKKIQKAADKKQAEEVREKDHTNLTSDKYERIKLTMTLVISVVVLWLTSWYLVTAYIPNWGDRGTFGDMFGAVNSLFSGLAFAGIIYTIYVQKIELRLQREELRMAREELRRSAEAQENSGDALKEQVDAFKQISEFIRVSIRTTRNLNTSRAVGSVVNSQEKNMLRKAFGIGNQAEILPLKVIEEKISKNIKLEDALQYLLGEYDQLCLGIQQDVYEQEIIQGSIEQPLIDTYIQFQEYIRATREEGHPHAWLHLEQVVNEWRQDTSVSDAVVEA